ncbi:unnamed protein product [Durusdinium trenchii]|uniref:Uncharacterized protein n=1 Tax=Durusdinium trenchii TaxID=1381693 RepID=A0ABP0KKR7_9DINO
MSMALSLYSASMEGGPKVRPRSAVKRCVPSPRSVQDSEPDLHEGFSSPSGEYFPLLVCSLTGARREGSSQDTALRPSVEQRPAPRAAALGGARFLPNLE